MLQSTQFRCNWTDVTQTPPGQQKEGAVLQTPAEDNELDFKACVLSYNVLNYAIVTSIDLKWLLSPNSVIHTNSSDSDLIQYAFSILQNVKKLGIKKYWNQSLLTPFGLYLSVSRHM